jgi:hypothetical protein
VLYSLIFSLMTEPPAKRDLVVRFDEHAEGQFTHPADPSKTLLDVGPGDGLIHQGQRETVKAVRPYRKSKVASLLVISPFRKR